MPSIQTTMSPGAVNRMTLDCAAGRVVVTVQGAAAEVYGTADGSDPQIPASNEVTGSQQAVSALVGDQMVLTPPVFGDHSVITQIRLISAGSAVVLVSW